MNLPNYFLADLGPQAPLPASTIAEACQTLKRNREEFLLDFTTDQLIALFHDLGRSWLDPEFRFRKLALQYGPAQTGFSSATLSAGLDAFFNELTAQNLQALIEQDLGHFQALDQFNPSHARAFTRTHGPELVFHIGAGNVPVALLRQIILGLLVRSAQLVKTASGQSLLPRLFAHSLYEIAPKAAACLEIADWPGGSSEIESVVYQHVDVITATGSDETLDAIRQKLPASIRFIDHGHRVSFGFICHDSLSGFQAPVLARHAALDVAAWNQLGCLSPHVFYVEHGGRTSAEQFAELLARELQHLEESDPRGPVSTEVSAAIATRRSFYEVRAAHSSETRCWFSPGSTAWSVIYESDPLFQISCLNRFIYVKGVAHLTQALQSADAIRNHVSTVGLAAPEARGHALASQLARWGATRICPIGRMQHPPLPWRHDGRPVLADLVTWTDWERS